MSRVRTHRRGATDMTHTVRILYRYEVTCGGCNHVWQMDEYPEMAIACPVCSMVAEGMRR